MPNSSPRALGRTNVITGALLLLALGGCNIDYRVIEAEEGDGLATAGESGQGSQSDEGDDGAAGWAGSESGRDGTSGGTGGSASTESPPAHVCRKGGECMPVRVGSIDTVDLLFMIDNSGSMNEEQAALRAQFPKLINVLTTGDRTPDDGQVDSDFPPAKNLHLGVVSSDLGLVGITGIEKCAGLGDDGVMNDIAGPEVTGCAPNGYPRFLTYTAGTNDPSSTANDLACIATLGTDGCGFEQQLESTLKAVWPADDPRVTFLPDPQGFGATGQGDNGGMNAGFLRSDPVEGLSLLSIVLVTDEEDCSSKDTGHFRPPAYLDPNNPVDRLLTQQGLNVRCSGNPQNLYPKDRYINAFKALRPGDEDLVLFSALVGVPPETVAEVPPDYGQSEAARAAFYQRIREHALMQPQIDTLGTPSPDDDTMRPSCDTPTGRAYPPNRIVDVAEGFGANGMVQSVCQEDFGPAVDVILERMAARLGAVCLPHAFERDAEGLLSCEAIWELPVPGLAPVGTPTACRQAPFLLPIGEGAFSPEGRELCRVPQLAVVDGAFISTQTDGISFRDGWYYDDFSDDAMGECMARPQARIAFTPGAMPPTGVNVYLDCER